MVALALAAWAGMASEPARAGEGRFMFVAIGDMPYDLPRPLGLRQPADGAGS